MSPRESRFASNQDLFRAVNDEIAGLANRWGSDLQIVCECANTGCSGMLPISTDEYARVRECPGWFLIVPGHLVPEGEYVIEHHDAYEIVKVQSDSD